MQRLNVLLFIVLGMSLFSWTACNKDKDDTEPPVGEEPVISIDTKISGRVVNDNDEAITGATITVGNAQTLSGENGVFLINTSVNEKRATIKVEKEGYFTAFPVIRPSKGGYKFVNITMKKREVLTSFLATEGGTAVLNNGTQVVFVANSFIDDSGQAYAGIVHVFATYIDPTADNLYQVMPGNLTAVNTENEIVGLKSFGMLNLELEDEAGNLLQINQNATITMSIPDELLSQAPATIPLWYFDENSGLWIEEGSATLQGSIYIGEVTHFTIWNCDDPFPVVDLSGQILVNTKPTNTVYVRITRLIDGNTGNFILDNLGYFGGLVPGNEPLLLEVVDECGEVIYSENIGPFTGDIQLATIHITPDNNLYSFIVGSIINCDGNAVTNGYVQIHFIGSKIYFAQTDENGTFSLLATHCGASSVSISAIDIENILGSVPSIFSVSETINAGSLIACGNIEEMNFARLTFDDGSELVLPATGIFGEVGFYTYHHLILHGADLLVESPLELELNFISETSSCSIFKENSSLLSVPFEYSGEYFPENSNEILWGTFTFSNSNQGFIYPDFFFQNPPAGVQGISSIEVKVLLE